MSGSSTPSARIAAITAELRELEDRRARLLAEQADLIRRESETLPPSPTAPIHPPAPTATLSLTPDEKIALFLRLFACRTDVYPRLWENPKTARKGYSPACTNEWVRGVCEKPRAKCSECPRQAFPPLDAPAVRAHLTGRHTLGTYAIRADDSCIFLAADFDGTGWRDDLTAYRRAAANLGLTVAVERSRSGDGGHAWLFFATPVPAALARRLGTLLVAHAAVLHPALRLETYDRFFPNQDTLPAGGFGNLIALPLQKPARDHGNSLFVDESFTPFPDQWAYLAALPRLTREALEIACAQATPAASPFSARNTPSTTPGDDEAEPFQLRADEQALDLVTTSITRDLYTGELVALREAQLEIPLADLPARLVAALKRLATFANPIFHEKQRLRFPTYDTPRFLFAGEVHPDHLVLPRGTAQAAAQLVARAGGHLRITDRRPPATPFAATFTGTLAPDQNTAVTALLRHDEGVLVAPPGAGKTVMACALIARRGVTTLILVHRKTLLDQWRERLAAFLGLAPRDIHVLGGPKRTAAAPIALGMLQTVARSAHPQALLAPYGHVIIDECHHIPAAGFEAALKTCPARFILGLTATPRRKDGLHPLLHLQCGPIRHRITLAPSAELIRRVIVRTCAIELPADGEPIHLLWDALVKSALRNQLIADDIVTCLHEGRALAVLSDRKEHLATLHALTAAQHSDALTPSSTGTKAIPSRGPQLFRLDGTVPRRERAAILAQLAACSEANTGFVLFATASLLGEGFDLPRLDTLFLSTPVSFSGRVVQYAGRLHRAHAAKTDVRLYDYHEPAHRLSVHMHCKRLRALTTLGYRTGNPNDPGWFT